MRLGSMFIDSKANETKDPVWTIIDINDKNKMPGSAKGKFKILKNGIFFNFSRTVANNLSGSPDHSRH